MTTPADIYQKHPDIVAREIADEFILVPVSPDLMKMHSFFTLNTVGRFIWDKIDGVNDLQTIIIEIEENFQVGFETARDDLFQLINELEQTNLISLVSSQ